MNAEKIHPHSGIILRVSEANESTEHTLYTEDMRLVKEFKSGV